MVRELIAHRKSAAASPMLTSSSSNDCNYEKKPIPDIIGNIFSGAVNLVGRGGFRPIDHTLQVGRARMHVM